MSVRLVNAGGRAGLSVGDSVVDVERRAAGRFSSDPMDALARWDEFRDWAEGVRAGSGEPPQDESALGPCVPRPTKVFGIGLNYRAHAAEAGLDLPKQPLVFTKFRTASPGRAPTSC